jgi:hypothetical protein
MAGYIGTKAVNLSTTGANIKGDQVVEGSLTVDGTITSAGIDVTGDVSFGDNDKAIFGAGSDLQIYHDPTGPANFINDVGGGDLIIRGSNQIRLQQANGDSLATFNEDGAVQLYHNAVEKLSTTATGIDVTGTITSDGLTVDGAWPLLTLNDTRNIGTWADGDIVGELKFTTDDAGVTNPIASIRAVHNRAGTGHSSNDAGLEFYASATTNGTITKRMSIESVTGDISFYEDTGTTPKFFWDASAESLGIGATTVDSQLHIEKLDITAYNAVATDGQLSAGATAFLQQTGGSNTALSQIVFQPRSGFGYNRIVNSGGSTPYMAFGTDDAERMRIDSSGNIVFGTDSYTDHSDVVIRGGTKTQGTNAWDGSQITLKGGDALIGGGGGGAGDLLLEAGNAIKYANSNGHAGDVIISGGTVTSAGFTGNYNPGEVIFKTDAAEAMRIDSSGNVLVGTTDPIAYSTSTTSGGGIKASGVVFGSVAGNAAIFNRHSSDGDIINLRKDGTTVGSISVTGSATTYNTSSDYRLKENITPIQGASDIVKMMRPCTYTFESDGSWADGFIAHEMQELHPQAVTGSKDAMQDEEYEVSPAVYKDIITPAVAAVAESPAVYDEYGGLVSELVPAVKAQPERTDQHLVSEAVMGTRSVPDYQGVDYSKLTPILTAALQEALTKIAELETQNAAFEERLAALERTS